ncbi:MAG: ATP-binding protein [Bacteroidales bacterium]|jgi:predicted AAA+ superfamily ATPase|nr:AAA family ATPase [Bacteroidales bacterium]MDY0315728.1 AAA family ATPase [Bacteroidales bacterium]NLB87392.1 ATP-binding protein [Bacteroidales bacterium]
MYRKIEKYLAEWKTSLYRKPLIIRGARQVGKTYTIEKFAKENFKHFLKINLEQDRNLHLVFESFNTQQIINELTALYQVPIIDGETLLFIDEIQVSPKAIASLRYFYEQNPGLHVISAGSLLDIALNEMQYSMPVGRVDFAFMYPMTFSEFLTAIKENGLVKAIDDFAANKTIGIAIHKRILKLLRLYFFIGGMPEAVAHYVNEKDLSGIEKIHSGLVQSIEFDFAKYGNRKQQEYLKDVLHYVANNIGGKVKYSNISTSVHSNILKDAFLKLEMTRIIHLVRHTRSSSVPLTQLQNKNVFKPIFMDIGMLNHIAGIKLISINNLVTDYEGALAEQFVLQELISGNKPYQEKKLNYWIREAKNSNAEIDCLLQIENSVYPIEIKAGKRGTLKSLHIFLAEKNKKTGIRLNLDMPSFGKDLKAKVNILDKSELTYNLVSLPLYLAGNLAEMEILI